MKTIEEILQELKNSRKILSREPDNRLAYARVDAIDENNMSLERFI